MYEQGVIRPPSEANSLLVRVTRNCPWNQCVFCPAYKGVKFSKRTVEEIKKDIDFVNLKVEANKKYINNKFKKLEDKKAQVLLKGIFDLFKDNKH